jgi:hypothetical protein
MPDVKYRYMPLMFLVQVCGVCWCPSPAGGPQGQNLLTTGEDGLVRLWRLVRPDSSGQLGIYCHSFG